MIVLGLIVAIVGWLLGIGLLLWLGVIVLVVGLVLLLLGHYGHPIGPRGHYW